MRERVLAVSGVGGEHICVSVQHLMRLLLSSALECKGLKICVETFFLFDVIFFSFSAALSVQYKDVFQHSVNCLNAGRLCF